MDEFSNLTSHIWDVIGRVGLGWPCSNCAARGSCAHRETGVAYAVLARDRLRAILLREQQLRAREVVQNVPAKRVGKATGSTSQTRKKAS